MFDIYAGKYHLIETEPIEERRTYEGYAEIWGNLEPKQFHTKRGVQTPHWNKHSVANDIVNPLRAEDQPPWTNPPHLW